MKTHKVKVYWEVSGFVDIQGATNNRNAAQLAIAAAAEKLPDDAAFVTDSLNVDEEIDVIETSPESTQTPIE